MDKLIALAVATVLSAIAAPAVATPVTWSFYETGAECNAGPLCAPLQPGYVIASLTIPGPTSTGSANYYNPGVFNPLNPGECEGCSFATTGDGENFSFSLFGMQLLSPGHLEPSSSTGPILYNFSWSDGSLDLPLNIQYGAEYEFDQFASLSVANVVNYLGFPGCAENTACQVTGFWQSNITFAGTPEQANCHGQSVSALAKQYGGINNAASQLGYSSPSALQSEISVYCEGSPSMAADFITADPGTDPIPEPTSVALLSIGLFVLAGGLFGRRRTSPAQSHT